MTAAGRVLFMLNSPSSRSSNLRISLNASRRYERFLPPTNCSSLETSVPGLPLKQAQCKRTVRPPPCHILQKSIYIKMDSTRAETGGPRGGIQGQAREPTARRGRWDTHLRLAGRSSLSDSLLQHPHDREANSSSSQNPAMSK